jgi:hypothetical protein
MMARRSRSSSASARQSGQLPDDRAAGRRGPVSRGVPCAPSARPCVAERPSSCSSASTSAGADGPPAARRGRRSSRRRALGGSGPCRSRARDRSSGAERTVERSASKLAWLTRSSGGVSATMWALRSNSTSSIHRGSDRPNGAGSSRQRHHGTSCSRPAARSHSASTDGRGRPPGAANTALKPTCICDCGDSRRKNEPSTADNRRP